MLLFVLMFIFVLMPAFVIMIKLRCHVFVFGHVSVSLFAFVVGNVV